MKFTDAFFDELTKIAGISGFRKLEVPEGIYFMGRPADSKEEAKKILSAGMKNLPSSYEVLGTSTTPWPGAKKTRHSAFQPVIYVRRKTK